MISAAPDSAFPCSIESLVIATKATLSANARKDTPVGRLFFKRPSYNMFQRVDPHTTFFQPL